LFIRPILGGITKARKAEVSANKRGKAHRFAPRGAKPKPCAFPQPVVTYCVWSVGIARGSFKKPKCHPFYRTREKATQL